MKELAVEMKSSIDWFSEARFGMFIHWGLYAAIGKGEWNMFAQKTPVHEYERIAETFNPTQFNAKEWVGIAKAAGMKYIVITTKHHDGFAMFQSQVDPYNIVDATPFGRDPLKELAEECAEQGVKLCFYYSHVIDWHHPHAIHEHYNNTWDYPLEEKAFYHYWNRLVKPHLTELLTNYGPIGLVWFDTSGGLSKKESEEIVQLVKSLQPDCLVNSRVSHWPNFGDYRSKGDNEIPMSGEDAKPWETPMTLNKSWGYYEGDQHYKSTDSIIKKLINIVSKGGNLLLNVGPNELGEIPAMSIEKLQEVGEWVRQNGESIYGTKGSPFPYEFDWGAMTIKGTTCYLHIHQNKWTETLQVNGIKTQVKRAYLLANPTHDLLFTQEQGSNRLHIDLPKEAPSNYSTVVALELAEELEIDASFIDQGGVIKLDFGRATIEQENKENTAQWQIKIEERGKYEARLITYKKESVDWASEFSEDLKLSLGETEIVTIPQQDLILNDSETCQYPYTEIHSCLGVFDMNSPGVYPLKLTSNKVKEKPIGPEIWQAAATKLRAVQLIKI